MKAWQKKSLLGLLIITLAGGAIAWYLFTETFEDTKNTETAYKIEATALIKEFQKDAEAANVKYAEKIIEVSGVISEVEPVDSVVNIKIADDETGSYIIFAFQKQDAVAAKQLKEGNMVSIKGSCSGGAYSEILEAHFISFKRCALNKT